MEAFRSRVTFPGSRPLRQSVASLQTFAALQRIRRADPHSQTFI